MTRPLRSSAPAAPLAGDIAVPGDKSISHRALMLAALAVGETRIAGLLEGEDVLRTAAAMRALGATLERDPPVPPASDGNLAGGRGATWRVSGRGIGGLTEPADVLDMGNSGTAARLLCGVLASHPIFSVLTGDSSLRGRPMRRVTDPLAACGARFASRHGGRLPLAVEGTGDALPIEYRLPVASAQVKSALLLAGLNARGRTRIEEPVATRDHTETMLRHFGATISSEPLRSLGGNSGDSAGGFEGFGASGPSGGSGHAGGSGDAASGRLIMLDGQPELRAADIDVPGDPSSAAFPVVAALLVPGSRLAVRSIGLNPLRTGLFATLREMGATLTVSNRRSAGGEPVGDLEVSHAGLRGVDVPAGRIPGMVDEVPVLAVAAACARGTTRIRGLAELRVKESDRLAATAALLAANGVRVEVEGDDLLVHGTGAPPPGGGLVETHMDHRLAMSALVLGLASRAAVRVDDGAFIDTSFPGFVALMNAIGAAIVDDPAAGSAGSGGGRA